MLHQIVWVLRHRMRFEIKGRTDDGSAPVSAGAHGNHIRLKIFAQPQTGIEALGDNVFETIIRGNLKCYIRIAAEKGTELGHDDILRGQARHGDAQRTRGAPAMLCQCTDDGIDIGQRRRQRFEEAPAFLCGRDAAGCAMKQPQTKAEFQGRDGMTDGRGRNAQLCRCLSEAQTFSHSGEDGELGELHTVHCSK